MTDADLEAKKEILMHLAHTHDINGVAVEFPRTARIRLLSSHRDDETGRWIGTSSSPPIEIDARSQNA